MTTSFSGDTGASAVAPGSVTSGSFATGAIAAADLASNSVTTAKIADANITAAKLATDAKPIGVNQTWQTFTSGQRAFGTTYTNTTGRPIWVHVASNGGLANQSLIITVGGVTIEGPGSVASYQVTVDAIVPDGQTYVVSNGVTFAQWRELR